MEKRLNNTILSSPVILINLLALFYVILWIIVPSFQNIAGGHLFRLIFFGAIFVWFFTSIMIKSSWISKLGLFNIIVVMFLFQRFAYLIIGYGDMSLLNFVSPLLLIIFIYIGSFYLMLNNPTIDKYIIYFSFILIVITAITTLIGLQSVPNASRYLASSSYSLEVKNYLASKNIASFDFIYSLTIAMPALIVNIKYIKTRKLLNKLIWFSFIILFGAVVFYSNFFTSYILLLFSLLIIFFSKIRNRVLALSVITVSILSVITILPGTIVFVLNIIQTNTTSPLIQRKITNVKEILLGQEDLSGIGSRYDLVTRSIESFLANPIIGRGAYMDFNIIGGHSQIFDEFARYGIVGGILYLVILLRFSKLSLYKMKTIIWKNAIFFSWISYLILNVLNPAHGYSLLLMIFLIIPIGCRYLETRNYKKSRKEFL